MRALRPESDLSALLSAEEEVELAKRIEAGVLAQERLDSGERLDGLLRRELTWLVGDGEYVKERFITANIRLVGHFASRFLGRGLAWDDVVQEGMLGLMHAVEMFDYTRGVKFSTYASYWIRQAMGRGVEAHERTIRLPARAELKRINTAQERAPSSGQQGTEDLSASVGVSAASRDATPQEALPILSLEMPWPDSGATAGDLDPEDDPLAPLTLGDVIFEDRPFQPATASPVTTALRTALEELPERDRDMFMLRAGVVDVDGRYVVTTPSSLQQIADRYGLTRERIRQIESRVRMTLASRLAMVDVAGGRS